MKRYKLCFYVPETDLDAVKNALFESGAGQIGDYSHCCWQTLGAGQFMPSDNANPFLGSRNQIETVEEYKVEMICTEEHIKNTVSALKQAHPYEEPAYDVWLLENI